MTHLRIALENQFVEDKDQDHGVAVRNGIHHPGEEVVVDSLLVNEDVEWLLGHKEVPHGQSQGPGVPLVSS